MVALGSDHGGYKLKEEIKKYFDENEIKYIDFGPDSEDKVDYPDYASKVAESIQKSECAFGILICRSGLGMSIAANKYKGIRCTPIMDEVQAKYAKMHNNANIIGLGADYMDTNKAINMIKIYMETEFEQRHQIRLDKIAEIENKNMK